MNITQYNLTNEEYKQVITYLETLHTKNCLIDIQNIKDIEFIDDKIKYETEKWVIIEDIKTHKFIKTLK